MTPPEDDPQLLEYLEGQSPLEEQQDFVAAAAVGGEEWVAQGAEIWQMMRTRPSVPVDADAFAVRLMERAQRTRPRPVARIVPGMRGSIWRRVVPMFATIIVVLGGIGLMTQHVLAPKSAQQEFTLYQTTRAQRADIVLPDGSRVTLAPESELRYAESASAGRRLDLRGQAVFTVTHDSKRLFVVHAGSVTTTVLGTTFGIEHDDHVNAVRVAVTEGRVSASAGDTSVVVMPGAVLMIDDSIAVSDPRGGAAQLTAWAQGQLIFDDMPLGKVLATLGRWYGYEFRVMDTTLNNRRVSLMLDIDKPHDAMKMLETVLRVTVDAKGNVMTLKPATGGRVPKSRDVRQRISPQLTRIGR